MQKLELIIMRKTTTGLYQVRLKQISEYIVVYLTSITLRIEARPTTAIQFMELGSTYLKVVNTSRSALTYYEGYEDFLLCVLQIR